MRFSLVLALLISMFIGVMFKAAICAINRLATFVASAIDCDASSYRLVCSSFLLFYLLLLKYLDVVADDESALVFLRFPFALSATTTPVGSRKRKSLSSPLTTFRSQ